jgi:hypothetical protein
MFAIDNPMSFSKGRHVESRAYVVERMMDQEMAD